MNMENKEQIREQLFKPASAIVGIMVVFALGTILTSIIGYYMPKDIGLLIWFLSHALMLVMGIACGIGAFLLTEHMFEKYEQDEPMISMCRNCWNIYDRAEIIKEYGVLSKMYENNCCSQRCNSAVTEAECEGI
jgi:hypothetical protein